MNAPIADQIKAEAAKSLLERMAEKTKLVRFFRYNASAKHGVPIDSDGDSPITFQDPPQEPEPMPAQPVEPQQPIIVEPVVVEPKCNVQIAEPICKADDKNDGMMKGILGALAAIALAIAAALGGVMWAGGSDTEKNTDVQTPGYYESPFQFLEDEGEHLP